MICALWEVAMDAGVSRTMNGNRNPLNSPFVRFVRAVQETFDGVPAWHQDNAGSLLTEIKKAIRAGDRAGK